MERREIGMDGKSFVPLRFKNLFHEEQIHGLFSEDRAPLHIRLYVFLQITIFFTVLVVFFHGADSVTQWATNKSTTDL